MAGVQQQETLFFPGNISANEKPWTLIAVALPTQNNSFPLLFIFWKTIFFSFLLRVRSELRKSDFGGDDDNPLGHVEFKVTMELT